MTMNFSHHGVTAGITAIIADSLIHPMKARRKDRFGIIAGGKIKRLSARIGRTEGKWWHIDTADKSSEHLRKQAARGRALEREMTEEFDELVGSRHIGSRHIANAIDMQTFIRSIEPRVRKLRPVLTRDVHVTRIGLVNGRRKVISDRIETIERRY